MPNPRVPDAVKRRCGTYRPDRAEGAVQQVDDEALTEYRQRFADAYARASRGLDVAADIEFMVAAETAMRRYGIADRNGSGLVQIAYEASKYS